jgi:hypothetical protein
VSRIEADDFLTPDEQSRLIEKTLADLLNQTEKGAERLTRRLFKHGAKTVTGKRLRRMGFEERLFSRWGAAFDLYELSLYLAHQCGEYFCKSRPRGEDHKFDALSRLHAGASRVAGEILSLLTSGYASGAHARRRTLHEISVIALFISQEGADVAERYHNHKFVKSYEDAADHRRFAKRLKHEPLTDKDYAAIEADYKKILDRYGPSFRGPFGWARAAIEQRDPIFKGRIGIEHIQDAIQIEHWRPYYRMASHAVHPSATFLRFNLGTPSDSPVLLAGPSNSGLSEPGQGALLSLGHATSALLTYDGNDNVPITAYLQQRLGLIAMVLALNETITAACDTFAKVEEQLDREIESEPEARIDGKNNFRRAKRPSVSTDTA